MPPVLSRRVDRVHDALLASEREAAKTGCGLLCLYPEVRHPRLAEDAVAKDALRRGEAGIPGRAG